MNQVRGASGRGGPADSTTRTFQLLPLIGTMDGSAAFCTPGSLVVASSTLADQAARSAADNADPGMISAVSTGAASKPRSRCASVVNVRRKSPAATSSTNDRATCVIT